jgi:hypothetical protein
VDDVDKAGVRLGDAADARVAVKVVQKCRVQACHVNRIPARC